MERLKVAFDIGGVFSRYPDQFRAMAWALRAGGATVFLLTDMNPADAERCCRENDLFPLVGSIGVPLFGADLMPWVLSGDWSCDGDRCKQVLMEEHGIDVLIDDRPDYCADGDFIGLVLSPRPDEPYYHPTWHNASTAAVCVPPEEYEEFRRWKAGRNP